MVWYEIYTIVWVALLFSAATMGSRKITLKMLKHYGLFLTVPWKLITFCVAISAFILVAPYTGDPTWDFATAGFMSLLTFLSAPWAVGVIVRVFSRRMSRWLLFPAGVLWMFSTSWSYDLYIWHRDGVYPVTWAANIFASAVLYLSAGLFWNLAFSPEKGVHFAFNVAGWPSRPEHSQFARLMLFGLPFMVLVFLTVLYFVLPALGVKMSDF